jgi:hypothetical protein
MSASRAPRILAQGPQARTEKLPPPVTVMMVGAQCQPDGAPSQSPSAKHTSRQAPIFVSHQLLRQSPSFVHAAPVPAVPLPLDE